MSESKNQVQKQAELTNEEIFDKKIEDTIEQAASITPSTRTISFDTELASSMTEDQLFELYRTMDNDAIVSATLDLFADNVAQENPRTGHVVSVVSKDKSFEEEINAFLHDVVNMDTESWNIVRSLAQYGKVILDTKASNDGADWAFIEVARPEDILPLTYGQDNIKYFAVKDKEKEKENKKYIDFYGTSQKDNNTYLIEQKDRYIAGFNARKHVGEMTIETHSTLFGEQAEPQKEKLYIRAGKSLLEGAVEAWQTLSALEDSLFISRIVKSSTFNIVSIDVSDTNNKQAQQMINEVKATLRASETIDKKAERYSNRQSPLPVNEFIYVPVKGEKGAISVEQFGGETGKIDLSDIDYYRNKLFAGLGALKAYHGFEETTPGGLGETTLMMLDERFARKVKRLRTSFGYIVKQIVDYYWVHSNLQRTLDNLPDYKVELGKISTQEEEQQRKTFIDDINAAKAFLDLTTNFSDLVNMEKLFDYIFTELIGIDVSKIDNKPQQKEVEVTLNQLKEVKFPEVTDTQRPGTIVERRYPKYRRKKAMTRKQMQYLESNYNLLMELPEVQDLLETHDIHLKYKNGKEINILDLLNNPQVRKLLGEKTYKDLKNKTQSQDPERIQKSKKITGTYIGYDPDEDVIIFEMTAEDPEKNKEEGKPVAYETQVRLKDLITYIQNRKAGETDLSIVRAAMQGDIAVGCECPASKYWGQQYNGTKEGYSIVTNEIEPTRNKQYQVLCKHVASMLLLLPFWSNTIVGDIRQAGTFKAYEVEDKEVDLTPEEEREVIDQIAGEDETTKTDTTFKDKPEKEAATKPEEDQELKDKVASGAQKTKKKK